VIARLRARRFEWPSLTTLIVLALVLDGLVLRLVDLGVRAMHHDESLHATYAWYFAEGRGYVHDPLMHGPLQFHLIAAMFKLFGSSEFTARLPAALLGTALIAAPLLLRRWLGGVGTVAAALFLALSPTLLYYSRFARNDIFIALFVVLMVTAIWRYRDDGRFRWLMVLAGVDALMFATKETTYLTEAVMLVYLEVVLWRALLTRYRTAFPEATREQRWRVAAALLPTAWFLAALWPLLPGLRARLGQRELPREGDLLLVLGTLSVSQLSALIEVPLKHFHALPTGDGLILLGSLTALAVIGGAVVIGLLWDPQRFALCFGLFLLITIPLYSTFGTNPDGIASGFWGSLDYWLQQQGVRRGEQPGFYYLMVLPIYELWVLIPALIGGAWLVIRRDRFAMLLAWWFVGTFVALSFAGEKMPWLTVHLVTPLALLAAYALGRALPWLRDRLSAPHVSAGVWGGAAVTSVLGIGLLVLTVHTTTDLSFGHPDTPLGPLIYTQTAPDVPQLSKRIVAALHTPGGPRTVVVDTTASLTWPWAWYLRDETVSYLPPSSIARGDIAPDAILIVADGTLLPGSPLRAGYQPAIPYHHRWWFPEEGYRAANFRNVARGLANGSLERKWWHFLWHGVDISAVGSLNGQVLFPRAGAASP
jgi:predicted membrane-bound mannosyltransferase